MSLVLLLTMEVALPMVAFEVLLVSAKEELQESTFASLKMVTADTPAAMI